MNADAADSPLRGNRSGPVLDALRLALGTLTTMPVPPPRSLTRSVAAHAMLLAPVAAVPLALLTAAVIAAADAARLPSIAAAAVAVGSLALASRGLHLDGLADTADGLASSYDRERALTVMRSGDVGPAGTATTVLVLLVQVACLASVSAASDNRHGISRLATVVVVAVLLSRCTLPLACARGVPSARASGLGATVADSVPRAVAAVPLLAIASLGGAALELAGLDWWRAPVAALAAVLVTAAIVVRCTRRLGGITGDVLGACVELSLAAALLVLATR
jgi:adenosylcobinamide-GDP ribazoletransferase